MSFSQQQASLFTVSVTNRTITPFGTVKINDERPRTPSGAWTFAGAGVYGTVYDMYAQASGGTQYTLIGLLAGTSVAGRTDLVLVGQAIDYASIANACQWLPLPGGSVDAMLYVDANGIHLRPFGSPHSSYLILDNTTDPTHDLILQSGSTPGVSSTFALGFTTTGQMEFEAGHAQGFQWDFGFGFGPAYTTMNLYSDGLLIDTGHLRSTGPAPSVATVVAGAGTGATAACAGTDLWGSIALNTGTGPVSGALATVTFAVPFGSAPYGVNLEPANAAAQNLLRGQDPAVRNTGISATSFTIQGGATALAAGTTYVWNYTVLGGG